jgi:hypothetical protein
LLAEWIAEHRDKCVAVSTTGNREAPSTEDGRLQKSPGKACACGGMNEECSFCFGTGTISREGPAVPSVGKVPLTTKPVIADGPVALGKSSFAAPQRSSGTFSAAPIKQVPVVASARNRNVKKKNGSVQSRFDRKPYSPRKKKSRAAGTGKVRDGKKFSKAKSRDARVSTEAEGQTKLESDRRNAANTALENALRNWLKKR